MKGTLPSPSSPPPNRDRFEDEGESEDDPLFGEALPRPHNQVHPAVDDHREEGESKGGPGGGKPPGYVLCPASGDDSESEASAGNAATEQTPRTDCADLLPEDRGRSLNSRFGLPGRTRLRECRSRAKNHK